MRHLGVAVGLLAVVSSSASCREDIELPSPDAVASDAAIVDDAGVDAGPQLQTDGAARVCDGAPPPACRALGDPCGSAPDCCSGRCGSGGCLPPGVCAGPGDSCADAGDCCSGLCEPVAGTTARACLAECRPDAAACVRASDCCSFACQGGVCGGTECSREGDVCTVDADCCSNECVATGNGGGNGNHCALDPVAACRATADDCTSGGGAPCCGACNEAAGRCDPGAGPCRPVGMICATQADCCNGTCTDDGTGRTVCTSPCLVDGVSCVAGFECCAGSCSGDPPACAPPSVACSVTGASCDAGAQCCSGSCGRGSCESGCTAFAP